MDYPVRTRDQLRSLLVAFRLERKLSQASLAGSLGITQQALSALESDPANASFERVLNVLSTLNVEIVLRPRQRAVMADAPANEPSPLKSYARKPTPTPTNPPSKKRRPLMARKHNEW